MTDHSIAQLTWTTPDDQDVTRQIAIPYEIDPLDLDEDEIRDLAISQGFNIYGDLSWEVLIDNSEYSFKYGSQRDALRLAKKLDRLMDEIQDAINELYEIAHNG